MIEQLRGTVAVLNVGDGDTRLSFDKDNPAERERASRIVADMLKRGYAILVQVGEKEGKPLFQRADAFDPDTCEYIIAGGPDEAINIGESPAEPKPKKRARRSSSSRIPAETTRTVAVGRTAGG